MSINRRMFLKASGGTVVTVAMSSLLMGKWNSGPESSQKMIREILSKRFPYIDLETQGVQDFENWFIKRSTSELGASSASADMAFDESIPALSFDRFVIREFAINTNFLEHKSPSFNKIIFQPAV